MDQAGIFHRLPHLDDSRLAEIFAREVLRLLVGKGLLSPEWAERILSWRHTGFNVHSRVRARTKTEAERYLVVWHERSGPGDDRDIRARVLNRDGSPASAVVALAYSGEDERFPKTAATGSSSWTAVWSTGGSIEACSVDATGKADDFRAVTAGPSRPVDRPDIGACSSDGAPLVVREEIDETGITVIKGRQDRFAGRRRSVHGLGRLRQRLGCGEHAQRQGCARGVRNAWSSRSSRRPDLNPKRGTSWTKKTSPSDPPRPVRRRRPTGPAPALGDLRRRQNLKLKQKPPGPAAISTRSRQAFLWRTGTR